MSVVADDMHGMIFRINDDGAGPELLKEAFLERGWIEYDEDIHDELQWNIWWKTSRFRTSDYSQLYPWQRVNHCPKATGITRKDCLARLLKLQQALHGSAYSFAPQAYILPNDYRKFTQEFSHQPERSKAASLVCWICKPADMSRGRGIIIIRELSELQYDTNTIVQQYISQPLLIHGYKFDIRLYVAVVSYHPLVIYLYNDGIVRFSCEKYDLSSLGNVYAHLTNTSINKYSTSYNVDKVGIGQGSKWTIKQLRHYLHQRHMDDREIWWKIISIINLTIIPQVSEVPRTSNCFELYGFDVLIDRHMKPWLLEVNFSPSLSSDCSADSIKKDMLSDLIDLMDFKPQDAFHGSDSFQQKVESNGYVQRTSCSRQPTARNTPRRPQSMITRLPKLATPMNARYCVSANDSSDPYMSDEEDEETSPPQNNILTCSLSQLNLPPSSLVNSQTASPMKRQLSIIQSRMGAQQTHNPTSLQGDCKPPPSLRPSTQASTKPKCYNKPWRQDSSSLKIQRIESASNSSASGCRRSVVGGFHRVYPFNGSTAARQLSPRQMVVETQQMIKGKLGEHTKAEPVGADAVGGSKRHGKSAATTIVSPFPDLKTTV